jgi:hypothetical protein
MVKYICYIQMTPDFLKLSLDERKVKLEEYKELAIRYSLKFLFCGSILGVREHAVLVMESREYSDKIVKFLRDIQGLGTKEASKYVEYTRTVTVF